MKAETNIPASRLRLTQPTETCVSKFSLQKIISARSSVNLYEWLVRFAESFVRLLRSSVKLDDWPVMFHGSSVRADGSSVRTLHTSCMPYRSIVRLYGWSVKSDGSSATSVGGEGGLTDDPSGFLQDP